MNIEAIIATVERTEVRCAQNQAKQMETAEVSVLGPMNMMAFDA